MWVLNPVQRLTIPLLWYQLKLLRPVELGVDPIRVFVSFAITHRTHAHCKPIIVSLPSKMLINSLKGIAVAETVMHLQRKGFW